MLANPILGRMTRDDLNQRYAHGFIFYDGKVRYCDGFDNLNETTKTIAFDVGGGIDLQVFNWKLLDTTRPESRWYFYRNPKRKERLPFFLSYLTTRQWRRSFSNRTMSWYCPLANEVNNTQNIVEGMFDPNQINDKLVCTTNQFLQNMADAQYMIASPLTCFVKEGQESCSFYYRDRVMAQVYLNTGGIHVYTKDFEQEVKEHIIDAKFEKVPPPEKPQHEKAQLKKARVGNVEVRPAGGGLWANGGIGGIGQWPAGDFPDDEFPPLRRPVQPEGPPPPPNIEQAIAAINRLGEVHRQRAERNAAEALQRALDAEEREREERRRNGDD